MGVSEATFYVWKKKYANLGVTELRKLKQLEDENARLKRLVADLTLDRHILQEVLRKKSLKPARRRELAALDPRALPGEREARVPAGVARSVSTWYCESQAKDQTPLRMRIREIAYASTAIRIPAHPGHAPTRGLGREPEARPSAVSARRAAGAHAWTAA